MAIRISGTQLVHLYAHLQESHDLLSRELQPFLDKLERELFAHLSVEEAEGLQGGAEVFPEKIATLRYLLREEEES